MDDERLKAEGWKVVGWKVEGAEKVMERVYGVLDLGQLMFLLDHLENVQAVGYGSVVIEFKDGHPSFLGVAPRLRFPKPLGGGNPMLGGDAEVTP